jgi:hypothetical protein
MNNKTPKWEEEFYKEFVEFPKGIGLKGVDINKLKSFIQSLLNQSNKEEYEKARQEGYEVGYAQGESDSGIPHPMIEFIKKEAVQEERKRIIAWANKMFKSERETWVNIEDLINFINK